MSEESSYYLTTHEKFYSWNMFRLADTGEKVTDYGNHKITQ